MKAAMLENDSKGNKVDLTFGKRPIKLTSKSKKELKDFKYAKLREYRKEADKRYQSRESFGGATTDEEIDQRNEVMRTQEFMKM